MHGILHMGNIEMRMLRVRCRTHRFEASLVLLLLVAQGGLIYADADNRPIVMLRIDDCSVDWATPFVGLGHKSALEYGTIKHIPVTWAVITSKASSGTSLTWAQLKAYLDLNGGEPASHSVSHSAMASQQEYIQEVVNSKIAIENNLLGYSCNTFIQPGTWTGAAYIDAYSKMDGPIGQAIQANYAQSMAYLGGGYKIGPIYYRHGTTSTLSIDAPANPSVSQLNYLLDVVAATPGLIFIIIGHGVQETGQSQSYRIPADVLKATMDKLADLRDQGKIRLMSLDNAFHTPLCSDLNRVPDPCFDLSEPSIMNAPWTIMGSGQMICTGGVDNSRYCLLPDNASYAQSATLCLPPGRYQLDWYQKATSDQSNKGLVVAFTDYGANWSPARLSIDWASFYNGVPSAWEKKTALVSVPYRMNMSAFRFQPASGGGYGIDNVSLVSAPVDPAVSPSAFAILPSPGQCTLCWHAPSDPNVMSITVRYDRKTHPLTPAFGTSLCSLPVQTDADQQIAVPLDWTSITSNYLFFSVFGLRSDESCSAPDIAFVQIDKTPPTTPVVTACRETNGTIAAQWTSSETDSAIAQYRYAVGTSSGDSSIKQWTATTSTSAQISGIPAGTRVYVSVMAQNQFGFWSACGSTSVAMRAGITDVVGLRDETDVCVSGLVTAIFSDCYYLQDPVGARGIKVIGNASGLHLGDQVTVTGTLTTVNGERCIQQ